MTFALVALALAGLPAKASQRYRWEIAGEQVGFAALAVRCAAAGCQAWWETAARLPEAGGGGVAERRLAVEADSEGRLRAARLDGGPARRATGTPKVAAILAEVLLSQAEEGERRCLEVVDEEGGEAGSACARRHGEWLEGTVLAAKVRFRARRGELPREVVLPEQGARFVADAAAALPERAPRLFGAEVPAPPGAEAESDLRLCGAPLEPGDPEPPPRGVPREFPEGGTCREQTARTLALAAGRGLEGRHVVGVAWAGAAFVWHEWAEVRVEGRWVAVDPAFRQVPAEGPRFAVARFAEGDAAARAEAGRRVLACWGRARVTRGR